jgi:DNA-binding transcriptional MerR regulator
VTFALVRTSRRLDLEAFCRAAGVHPELVRRLVALGLLEPERDASGALWFTPGQLVALARIQRLRAGLGINYAAVGLVIDLLDRVAALERDLRKTTSRPTGGRPWT